MNNNEEKPFLGESKWDVWDCEKHLREGIEGSLNVNQNKKQEKKRKEKKRKEKKKRRKREESCVSSENKSGESCEREFEERSWRWDEEE